MARLRTDIIGNVVVSPEPSEREMDYAKIWNLFQPKVCTMAKKYCLQGAVGADLEDLMEHAQSVLLQALRTHEDDRQASFSTYYYSLLQKHFSRVLRQFPRGRWHIEGSHRLTGQAIPTTSAARKAGLEGEVCVGVSNLEARMLHWRELGYEIHIANISTQSSFAPRADVDSIDYCNNPDDDYDITAAEAVRGHYRQELSHREINFVIQNRIPNPQLQQLVFLLLEGRQIQGTEPLTGQDNILKELGLSIFQYKNGLKKVQRLLAEEFLVCVN